MVAVVDVELTEPESANFDSEDDYRTSCQTPVTVNNNSPIQDYVHPDDHTQPTLPDKQGITVESPYALSKCEDLEVAYANQT